MSPADAPGDAGWTDADRAILAARTRALATPAQRPAPVDALEVLHVRAGGERYALPLASVRAVAALERLTPLPHAPAEVAGLTARGGAIVPAFHLRAVLGLPLVALPEHGRMLLLGDDDDPVALVVDAVEGTAVIAPDALRDPPSTTSAATRALLRGVDAEGVGVLDAAALLASDRLVIDVPAPRPTAHVTPTTTTPSRGDEPR